MSTKLVTFRMDEEVKEEFDSFCGEVGISASGMFNMFARTVVREKRIPFEIGIDPFYGEKNMRVLQESIKDANAGKFAASANVDDFDALGRLTGLTGTVLMSCNLLHYCVSSPYAKESKTTLCFRHLPRVHAWDKPSGNFHRI